jgi:hypothetical protein
MNEADIMRRVQKKASNIGYRIFRNNVGLAWIGKVQQIFAPQTVKVYPGDVVIRGAQPVKFGLVNGSSDLIGWKTRIITPEMIGEPIAVFTAIECKSEKGVLTDEQAAFLKTVKDAGGIALEVRSESELQP